MAADGCQFFTQKLQGWTWFETTKSGGAQESINLYKNIRA
jgi:hypothetical protein